MTDEPEIKSGRTGAVEFEAGEFRSPDYLMNNRYTVHALQADVLVAGGGPAGVPAAIAAARAGAKVILCHDRPMLGGNASSEIRMHVVGANAERPGEDTILEPRETGIIEEIRLENAVRNPQRSASMFDLILYEKCRSEPNLTLFLNTTVYEVEMEGSLIRRVHAVRHSTEDLFVITSDVFIDCTGDGSLGVAAGASFIHGREGNLAYGETLGPEAGDQKTLGSTLLFTARRHDVPIPFYPPEWIRRFTKEDFRQRATFLAEGDHTYEYGYWWIEWGGTLDTIKDNEIIRDELTSIVLGVWDYIKNRGDHDASHWALDWFGVVPGKRESRRFIGQHVLCENDLLEAREFSDSIAYGGWPLDLHPPEGIDNPEVSPCTQTEVPLLYEIPLSSCVSGNIDNLMFAGRNISATHVAFASTRVMATCAVVGEGVGVAAAYSSRLGLAPSALTKDEAAMKEIRQHLTREDAFLIGELHADGKDMALSAKITASSEKDEGQATNIISGQNRAVQGHRGVRESRLVSGTHRWMSVELPAWIELRWDRPQRIEKIKITFDTGLHRHLTLTHSDHYLKRMHWGKGQPETAKDFSIEVETSLGWKGVAEIRNNWSRRREHQFSDIIETSAIRVVVTASWQIDHARIMQISVH